VIHFGGDSGDEAIYRPRLWLWNNTVVSTRSGNTTLLRLSTPAQQAHVHGNVVWVSAPGTRLGFLDADGQAWFGHNWLPAGWRPSHSGLTGTLLDEGGNLTGSSPGFVNAPAQDFRLAADSPCLDAAGVLPAQTAARPLSHQYVPHQQTRPYPGAVPTDLGAFPRGAPAPPPTVQAEPPASSSGCSSSGASASAPVTLLLAAFVLRRRRP
jgi:uncharacterized protein (TIGR03382 family)